MKASEKKVTYTTSNTYSSLNTLTKTTKNVWFVMHGIGYLSKYFLKYFDQLPAAENYVIAPQAPSKYYLGGQYKHVGASWLTRDGTEMGIENVLRYLDAVYEAESIPGHCRLIIFGFSQGVSIAARWVARSKIRCNHLVFYAGGIPRELRASDFDFLLKDATKISMIVGDQDEFITPERYEEESKRLDDLFQGRAERTIFKGGHQMKRDIIKRLVEEA